MAMSRECDEPLVMCVTNTVAANFTANVLIAAGAKPAMIENPEEAERLAAVADAVLVNVGTVNDDQAEVMYAAVSACARSGTPWALDPVAIQLLDYRRGVVDRLLAVSRPALVRGNHGEIDFLRRERPVLSAAVPLLSTGPVDRVYLPDGTVEEIAGGTEMLPRVTATGCAQGALCAAYLGRGLSPADACRAASRLMKTAGERAAARASAPGSFQSALLDEIYICNMENKL